MKRLYRNYLKRGLDFFVALGMLILALPIMIILICILYFANNKQVFFLQTRPGRNTKVFRIIKFKTMTDERDASGNLLPEEFRITPAGKFIRKYSLDEIPQLINVVKGDMSLIGPRPLLVDYLSLYNEFQKRRHEVRPGITGWAQINGRNAITWDQKFDLDIWYVDNLGFWLDVRITLKTIKKVLYNEGGSPQDAVVMEKFMGNQ